MKKGTIILILLAVILFLGRPQATEKDLNFPQRIISLWKKAENDLPFLNKCQLPLKYSLGTMDSRFNLSQEEIRKDIVQAENIWEKALGINLFQYQEDASFKINFVFDERQERTLANQKLNQKLDEIKTVQGKVGQKYQNLLSQYKKKASHYKKEVSQYNQNLKEYNQKVSYWNGKGGAPSDEYDKLQQEKKELNQKQKELEKERKAINNLVKQINDLAFQEKKAVKQYNQEVETYQNRYGESTQFDQGKYWGDHIDIYEFKNQSDLILVLAHELGHALHMEHVANPHSIMYYLVGQQNLNHLQPTAEDLAEIKKVLKEECPKLSF